MSETTPPGGGRGVSRKGFLQGTVGAAAAGLVVGGGAGYVAGHSGSDSSSSPSGGSGSGSTSKGKLKIGSASPITGPFAGDGEQMIRGQELAVEELNAAGGVAGYELELVKLDSKAQEPDVMKTVIQNLVSQKCAMIHMPFCSYTSVEFPILAQAKIPTFHVNTWHGNVDWVDKNGATNIFQGDPSELSYGAGIVSVMDSLTAAGSWTPSKKTAYVVTSNDPYSLNIAKSFQTTIKAKGWDVVGFEQFTVPQANWGGVLVKIRDANPGVIVFSDYAAGDEAAFMKQFATNPTKSLVYQQYAPSIPQYLDLAGDSANGVIWSTVVGILQNDPVAQPFIDKFTAKHGTGPGFSNAGDQYDLTKIWAQAVGMVGDPFAFDKINAHIKATPYRGVCGAYTFNRPGLTCIPYPDETPDPSIGMAHLTFQIQNGQQVAISPAPYTTGSFQLPTWLQ
ncbi:MAG: branched-chain amino acid transport system substrate-binding protein [Gaiellales bacterium]|jgi:branched-chain amino acid transport system substrate-binding protein|nr:branched-chain amino acid transport system substrate-binding protein [Gaiellales bacterium]